MPYSVTFEEPQRFVMRQWGAIPAEESRLALGEIAEHPRFGAGATVLAIVSGATSAPASDELSELAAEVRTLVRRGLAGFVIVAEPGFIYGVARMFSASADMLGVHTEVTESETEGRQILDRIEKDASRRG